MQLTWIIEHIATSVASCIEMSKITYYKLLVLNYVTTWLLLSFFFWEIKGIYKANN